MADHGTDVDLKTIAKGDTYTCRPAPPGLEDTPFDHDGHVVNVDHVVRHEPDPLSGQPHPAVTAFVTCSCGEAWQWTESY